MKWAYHGTQVATAAYQKRVVNRLLSLPPEDIADFHLQNIASQGLTPRVSTRQLLSWRKGVLGELANTPFIYFYSRIKDRSDVSELVTHYGGSLVMRAGGMVLRFPMPSRSRKDPDEPGTSHVRMTQQAISPYDLQVFVTPSTFYKRLGGPGTDSWSSHTHANNYLLQGALESESNWHPLLSEDGMEITDPWTNQDDIYLDELGM